MRLQGPERESTGSAFGLSVGVPLGGEAETEGCGVHPRTGFACRRRTSERLVGHLEGAACVPTGAPDGPPKGLPPYLASSHTYATPVSPPPDAPLTPCQCH